MESSKTKKKTKEEVMGMGANKKVEYMCSYCGTKQIKPATAGRPLPGSCRAKAKSKDGKMKPHSWVKNRVIG